VEGAEKTGAAEILTPEQAGAQPDCGRQALRFGAADSQGESRCSESTGKIAYATLPAIEGWVADVAAGYEIDYVFGYVGGVVADAFEIFCYQD